MEKRIGTFYGVSVGPGDPELMTLQAVRRLENCPVIAAPTTRRAGCWRWTSQKVRWI